MTEERPLPARIDIRPITPEDLGYVLKSWMGAEANHVSDYERACGFDLGHREVVLKIIQSGEVWLAVKPDRPESILGFVCVESVREDDGIGGIATYGVMHAVYVRSSARRRTVAAQLIDFAKTRVGDIRYATCGRRSFVVTRLPGACWCPRAPIYKYKGELIDDRRP